jgi:S1-C subfamily serine protease
MQKRSINIGGIVAVGCLLVLAAMVGSAVGAGGMYLALRAQPTQAAALPAPFVVQPTLSAPTSLPPVAPAPSGGSSPVATAVDRVGPAVVTITNHLGSNGFGSSAGTATGSGVIISDQGYIVTNNHVVEGMASLEVTFANGSKTPATLVGSDPFADIAVVKVSSPVPATAAWGDSSALSPGDTVVAIGSPLGDFTNTVTAGIVSATDRSLEEQPGYKIEDLIQTDAAINSGNSGGPLVNIDGQIVGINTLIVRGSGSSAIAEGLGFAVESNRAHQIADAIIANGVYPRPYLGVQWQWVTPDVAQQNGLPATFGAYLSEVVSDGPAAKAGLQRGDVLTGIDGTSFDADHLFLNMLLSHQPGDQVTFTVIRQGSTGQASVTLGTRPAA